MEQNDRLEKKKIFFQGKQLLNAKLLPLKIYLDKKKNDIR